ncbi:hypothetical protein NXW09_29320 [Bacteroides ovatus]|nr:hypothetical protein [Bacteroides ovatus]
MGCGGLLPCHRQVLQGKDKTNESGYNTGELKKWQPNGQGVAEEIIRENRYPSGYDIQDYLFDNEDTVLSLEDGTGCLMTSTSGKNVPTSNLKKSWTGTTGPRLVDIRLKTGI